MNRHWHYQQDENGIGWLKADIQGSSTNTLSREVIEQLGEELERLHANTPIALVVGSSKRNGFFSGADVNGFRGLSDRAEVEHYIQQVHGIFERLENMPCPTIAQVHGFCLGGGLELALCCRYVVACDDEYSRLGFPEVRLGIFPGFGGTARTIRKLGSLPALRLMLSGRTLSAKAAKKIGLVDLAVPERQLQAAVEHLLLKCPPIYQPAWWDSLMNLPLMRQLVAGFLKRKVRETANPDHYPAPYSLIDHWSRHGNSFKDLLWGERTTVAELITGSTAQNLVRVFGLQEKLKAFSHGVNFKARHVHVIGGGIMGGDIAAWCAWKGFFVTLQDREPKYLTRAMERAHRLFERKARLNQRAVQAAFDRLMPDPKGFGLTRADVVIEAIFEDLDAKRSLFAQLEPRIRKDALLASNTSSIPLQAISAGLDNPSRLVGLHFFNPVAQMQLVEVVAADHTDEKQLRHAIAFTRAIDRLPLPVRSSPGFLVNRVLMPYLLEAVSLLDEGHSAEVIDRAAMDFGMPMGPIELADSVGLDICLSVGNKLSSHFDLWVPGSLKNHVRQGYLGKKSGRGFYTWNHRCAKKGKASLTSELSRELSERMILRMLNEAVACINEGIVENEDLLDAGMIFGTGFAPFRGGPMHYIHQVGEEKLHHRLEELHKRHGNAFNVSMGWDLLSRAGGSVAGGAAP
jgi:3-hydroxyacyl-CoA dehydrogenase/enoyl-CoA hydratase/3-hydroxybutyryl-CoA epimerase